MRPLLKGRRVELQIRHPERNPGEKREQGQSEISRDTDRAAINSVRGENLIRNKLSIPLSRPDITEREIAAIIDVLKTPYLSLGPKLGEFEEKFAAYIGAKYAVAVSSGTSGLHLAVKSLGIGENDAVITTPFSFIASANCILYEKALPVFVDIETATCNIDPSQVEEYLRTNCERDRKTGRPIDRKTGRNVSALLPVHVFGEPCGMAKLGQLAEEYHLAVIEDACEATGSEYEGKKVGTFGDVAVYAFYPNKQMTTGEGGIIVTDREDIAALCRSLRNQGRDNQGGWLAHRRLGFNYRISDINCALGIAQLERIGEILRKREGVAARYSELLRGAVRVPEPQSGARRSWFVYVVHLVGDQYKGFRMQILEELAGAGIGCSNYFPPIHLQPFYQETFGYREGDYAITEDIAARTIALPFHNNLTTEEIEYVAATLKDILRGLQ